VSYPYNLGLIDSHQRDDAEAIQDKLVAAIHQKQWDHANDLSNDLEAFVLQAALVVGRLSTPPKAATERQPSRNQA